VVGGEEAMTDIIWTSTEENVNWGEWKEVERLPFLHRITRWMDKRRGFRYVVGLAWPRRAMSANPEPLMEAVFGPVAPAQQQVIALLSLRDAIPGEIVLIAVASNYEMAKLELIRKSDRTRPNYEVSSARPLKDGGFEAIYTPVDD
jgi:hypothetical protein